MKLRLPVPQQLFGRSLPLFVLLCAVYSTLAAGSVFAQEWANDAQGELTGRQFGLKSVDSGMRLPDRRYGMPAVVVGDSIFVIGGSGPGGFKGDVVKITPKSRSVTVISRGLLPRRYHAAAAAGRYIFIFGGVNSTDTPSNITEIVERFDTRSGEIQLLAPMPIPLRLPGAVTVGKKIYVMGGSDRAGKYRGTVAIYNTEINTWSEGPQMPAPRECSFAFRDGIIYAVGGFNGSRAMPNFDCYSISTKRWTTLPPLPFTLSAHHTDLLNGRIYAFGDFNKPERGAVYDFEQRRWGPLLDAGFAGSRNNPVVALDGILYVIGGNTSAGGATLDLIQALQEPSL